MNKFLRGSITALAAIGSVAPSTGHSFLYQAAKRAPDQKPSKSSLYRSITPKIVARDLHVYGFTQRIDDVLTPSGENIGNTFCGGFGLNFELGWKNSLRIKGRSLASGAQAAGIGTVVKGLFFDTDAQVTLFAPVNDAISMLFTGGWEYKWGEVRDRAQGFSSTFTTAKLRLNGPFMGIGVNFRPSCAWTVESGINYHIPDATGRLRARDIGDEPQEWLVKEHYRGARFGLGSYIEATWQSNKHWSMTLSIEGLSMSAKGGRVGPSDQTSRETGMNVMGISYVNYGFGLNYEF